MPSKSFAALKKSRKDNFSSLKKKVQDIKDGKKSYEDDRFWKLDVDRKTGNGYAIIRFLPSPDTEESPWAKYWDHGFKGDTGKWYIENSRTTFGDKDPVSEDNSRLWNSGDEENKELARKRKRRLRYVSNVLIVEDKANPENEGKVFLYRYGKKIHDMITSRVDPEFDDETPIDPFDLWEGANFKLRSTKVSGYPNYDKSTWEDQSPVAKTDDEIEEIWKQGYALSEFTDPANFKSYDELKAKFEEVVGYSLGSTGSSQTSEEPRKTRAQSTAEDVVADTDEDDQVPWSDDSTSETDADAELAEFEKLAGE